LRRRSGDAAMRSLFLLGVWGFFLLGGTMAPFVFGLGYIWVDVFAPQRVSYTILNTWPVALILGAACVGAYLVADRKHPPPLTVTTVLMLLWVTWFTATTFWAVLPEHAWVKWDWASKAVLFAAFMPFLFRSRVQIEAVIATIIFALSGSIIAFGAKTLLTGGGYGRELGLYGGNVGLGEGSTLALSVASIIPLILFLMKHSLLVPRTLIFRLMFVALIFSCLLAIIGTHARTGLICLFVLAGFYWWTTKRKIIAAIVIAGIVFAGSEFVKDDWSNRMSTIESYGGESSALGRIAVWLWTLEYARDHPLGGGFGVYRINRQTVPMIGDNGEQVWLTVEGKAFHSAYFEVLGEQGFVGFAIYALLLASALLTLRKARAVGKKLPPGDEWAADLASAMLLAMIVYMAGSAFVGIAHQPIMYYYIACAVSLRQYVARVAAGPAKPAAIPAGAAPAGRSLGLRPREPQRGLR